MATKRDKRTAKRTTTTVPTTTGTAIIESPTVDTAIAPVMRPALTLASAGATVPDGYVPPAYIGAFVDAFRAVSAMPSATPDERRAIVTAFAASMDVTMPGTPMPVGRHTGRFTSMPVFESQNTLFVAAAMANVPLTNGHIMAAWRVELPNAKCDYIAKNYAWTTLSEYINGRHNGTVIPDGVVIVAAWAARHRVPVDVTA